MKEPEPRNSTLENKINPIRRVLIRLVIAGPVIATAALGCEASQKNFPTSDDPLVRINDEDSNKDGGVDIQDGRLQRGPDWPAGYDVNANGKVDTEDQLLVEGRVCTIPALRSFDIDGNGHVFFNDAELVAQHFGKVKNDRDPNVRLAWAMEGYWLPNKMVVNFKEGAAEKMIEDFIKTTGFEEERYESGKPNRLVNKLGTTIFVTIPDKILETTNLDTLIERALQQNGVVSADRYFIFDGAEEVRGKDPACDQTPTSTPGS